MHINITAQKIGRGNETYNSSATDFVNYLEKENEEKHPGLQEHFFDQYNDKVSPEKVISEIDGNTRKLRRTEPKFYSLTVSPSAKELKHINNDPSLLRKYVRELMKDYAASFHRDREITASDIKYYAKIEHERTYMGFDKKIEQNAPYRKQIAKLKNDIAKVERGEINGSVKKIQKQIDNLIERAPHKVNGKLLTEGMKKEGAQTHVHIIVSKKDVTNSHILSPGAVFKENTTNLNGKDEKQGFHRKKFFDAAEKRFDTIFGYDRKFVERFSNRNLFRQDPKKFFAMVAGLPTNEKEIALKMLYKSGIPTNKKGIALKAFNKAGLNVPNIPTNKVQLAIKAFNKLKKGLGKAVESGSIGV
ncbi:MobB family relaxase [Flagellimonas onchidii]|uniref:MobB family relaxase n=1 Tax=Flagellimonas onchidii TaxID=2562684 RepID=UPI0010A62DDA|nr:MobB family relaxase [Allomuricauda onchidii]